MSYWLKESCGTCKKEEKCTDRHLLRTAIHCIHSMPYSTESGHLGAGEVELKCQNHDAKETADAAPTFAAV